MYDEFGNVQVVEPDLYVREVDECTEVEPGKTLPLGVVRMCTCLKCAVQPCHPCHSLTLRKYAGTPLATTPLAHLLALVLVALNLWGPATVKSAMHLLLVTTLPKGKKWR